MTPLEQAARAAQHAPSVFNTQPWNWQITGNNLELFADPGRRVDSIDRDGRLLLLSCGAALHHARTYLAAAGWSVTVERMPDAERPQLLARVTLGHPVPPDPEATRMAAAIARRRTDRRAFDDDRPVTDFELTKLRRFVEIEGAHLHTVRPDQVAMLAISTELAAGAAHDQGAAYVVLFGLDDEPKNLLRGGEALSALLLATAPLSDAVEVEWPRHLVRGLIADIGEPYLVVRLGHRHDRQPVPAAPRRDTADAMTTTR